MVELYRSGELFFMNILSCLLLMIVFLALVPYHRLLITGFGFIREDNKRKKSIRSIGLFALIFGLFSQLLGLYGALESIRTWGEVKADTLYQGLKVSAIPACYGLLILGIGLILSKPERNPGKAAA